MTAPTIAILDNDPAFLSLMHDLLTDAGYRTLRCRPWDVLDAHALVKRYQPALVVLDRWWRRSDAGWEFLKTLWADHQTTHIGVVLTCGKMAVPSLRDEMLDAMHCQRVRMPLDRHELLRAVAAMLDASSARRIPARRGAAVSAPVPFPMNGVRDARTEAKVSYSLRHVPEVTDRQRAEEHGHAARHRDAWDERASRRGASARDAASDSEHARGGND